MNLRCFTKVYEPKTFLSVVLTVIFSLHLVAFAISQSNISYSNNELILETQLKKINSIEQPVKTIIVGDSSAGNAIDAEFFTELSGDLTLNLSLTGSYGIIGSLNMVKQARRLHPEIENILIMQTLGIWNRPFPREGFFMTESGIITDEIDSQFFATYKWLDRFMYKSDIRWIYKAIRYAFCLRPEGVFENDYFRNTRALETYHNGKKHLEETKLLVEPLDLSSRKVYLAFDRYCAQQQLNCIFANGPMHEDLIKNTDDAYFNQIFDVIDVAKNIYPFHVVFAIPNENMGDSADHVDISYKREMTKRYFAEVDGLLR